MMVNRNFTPEELLTRWESRRELQNIMGKLTQSYLMMEEAQIYDRWWSQREDVCLGINTGWYNGKAAVKGYYEALGQKIALASKVIRDTFPEKLSGKTEEELYGVGQLGVKPADTFVIEIAGDGQTAKGLWSLHGTYADITPSGPVSYWDWGYYCVDFINEDGAWKIWHMQNLNDILSPTGGDWADAPLTFPEDPHFAPMKDFKFPEPNVPAVLREAYYPGRPFTESPALPEPYETFAETFSYGI
jgi:hypothetical protein